MTVTEQTTQQTPAASSSSAHASVELSERGGSVSIDGTFHALRASNVDDARMEALELLRRFAGDVDYGLLAVPDAARFDTRGAVDPRIRCGQRPDLVEDLVDPALGKGADLSGLTLGRDGWMVVAGVVGQYGVSAGSYEDIIKAPVERFEVDGVDARAFMTRQVWGARLLQCPPGVVPDSDDAERWTFTIFPAEGLVDGRAVSGTVLKKRVRFRLGKANRGIGSARVSPALPLM